MVMERLADFVSKSLEGGEAPAPPPEPGEDDADDVEVDITALEDKLPPAKKPRNWLVSPVPSQQCKRELSIDDDDDGKHGELRHLLFYVMLTYLHLFRMIQYLTQTWLLCLVHNISISQHHKEQDALLDKPISL